MEINYIKGSKKEFFQFVDLIAPSQKVAILPHNDLDGLSSAVFLEKILNSKNIDVYYIDFLNIKSNMFKEIHVKLTELDIDKVFICDIGADVIDFEGYKELRDDFDVFLIDHHPMSAFVTDWDKIIKTDSQDCSAMVCYFLGEGLIDYGEWDWLCSAAIFSDFSYKEKKNLEYIQSVYPGVTSENISSSTPGINGRKINSGLIYYESNLKYVFDLVKDRKIDEISRVHEVIEEEIEKLIEEFSSKGEHFLEKKLHIYEIESKFNVLSTVTTLVSKMKPEDVFVFMQRKNGNIKFSARNQVGEIDLGALMRKCTFGLEYSTGGGHKSAAAGVIRAQDFDEFKKRLLEFDFS